MVTSPSRKLFTVDEYYRMLDVGVIRPDDRIELIEGEIVQMAPMSCKHGGCITYLIQVLNELVNGKAIVNSQIPLHLNDYSEPEPDVCILKNREDFYRNAHATPKDILLVIEVSLSTLSYDLNAKIPMYANSGVIEVWVVDLENEEVHQFTEPLDGEYQNHIIHQKNETVQAQQIESAVLSVNDILGIES